MMPKTHTIGSATSVASRFGSENGIVRPEVLLDVPCFNNTGGVLYMLVFEITNSLIPFGTAYSGAGGYTLTGLTIGHTYSYLTGAGEPAATTLTNGAQVFTVPASGQALSGTFVATATTLVIAAATDSANITANIQDVSVPNNATVPAEGAVPKFAFPVQGGLGGSLGKAVDMSGIYCCWSSTQATKTIAAASGSIAIIIEA